jgi:predicted alpha-1,2-mannosidase
MNGWRASLPLATALLCLAAAAQAARMTDRVDPFIGTGGGGHTFPGAARMQVLADLQHGLRFGEGPRVTAADVQVDAAAGEISGTVHSKNWVERQASFVLRFDRPIAGIETLPPRPGDKAPRYLLRFDLPRGAALQARVALSTVDVPGARDNLAEADGRSFERIRADADRAWATLLGRIRIEAPPRQQRIFTTALYHALIHPSDIADRDGRVRGPTGEVFTPRGGHYCSTLSLWDTFRGLQPLLDHQRFQGYLPLWTAWGRETWTMIGNPALPVIADAVAQGFGGRGGFEREEALRAMLQTATAPRPAAPAWAQRDWAGYEELGYLPIDQASGEAVSRTLEYGIGDAAVARVAAALGQADVAQRFAHRAQGWRALWDADTQSLRGRDSQGRWRTPFDPLAPTSPMNNPGDCTEANVWQYTLTPALHDPAGLVQVMGGAAAFERWLDRFFATDAPGDNKHLGQEGLIGQYAHGNEPSHHIAYLYAWTAAPWKGHALIQRIVRDFHAARPDGIIGNDDCGQMSAWLVLSTLGFYPVVPAGADYALGAPQVRRARVALPGGRVLRIVADGHDASRPYAGRATLAGRAVEPRALAHAELLRGGVLRDTMRPLPS